MMSLRLLLEGSRDNMLLKYLEAVKMVNPEMTLSLLKKILLEKLVSYGHIMSLSLGSNFYLAGAAKYYFNGDLTNNKEVNLLHPEIEDDFNDEVCQNLSKIIKHLRNKYLDSDATSWEQPEDFGELSIDKLFRKYKNVIAKKAQKEPAEDVYKPIVLPSNYNYEIIYSFNDAQKYARPNAPYSWCVTTGEGNLNHYQRVNNSFFVFFYCNDWQNVERKKGKDYPLDEYGLSAMAMQLSRTDGHIVGGTTRWNHGDWDINNADNQVDQNLLCQLTGITSEQLKEMEKIWAKNVGKKPKEKGTSAVDFAEARRQFSYIKLCMKNNQSPFLPLPRNENGMFSSYQIISCDENCGFNGDASTLKTTDEFKKKLWKRCLVLVTIVVNDIKFTTILDHGVLKNNELLSDSNAYAFLTTNGTDENDRIIKKIDENYLALENKTKKYLYDVKRRRLVTVNDNKLFSNIICTEFDCIILMSGISSFSILRKSTGEILEYNNRNEFEKILSAEGDKYYGSINITRDSSSINSKLINVVVEYATQEVFLLNLETFQVKTYTTDNGHIPWIATCVFGDKNREDKERNILYKGSGRNFILLRKCDDGLPKNASDMNWNYARGYGYIPPNMKYNFNHMHIPHFKVVDSSTMKEVKWFKGVDIRALHDNWLAPKYINIIDYDIRDNVYDNKTNDRFAMLFDMEKKKFLVAPNGENHFITELYGSNLVINGVYYVLVKTPSSNGYLLDIGKGTFLNDEIFNDRLKRVYSIHSMSNRTNYPGGNDDVTAVIIKYNTRCKYSNSYCIYLPSKNDFFRENGEVKRFKNSVCISEYAACLVDLRGVRYIINKYGVRLDHNTNESCEHAIDLLKRLELI